MPSPESIEEIAENIHQKLLLLIPADKDAVQEALRVGLTTVECIMYIRKMNSEKPAKIIDSLVDEIFVDYHICLMLAASGQTKPSLVLLRCCLESCIYSLYFIDHPVEAILWSSHMRDLAFASTLAEFENEKYFTAAGGGGIPSHKLSATIKQLRVAYRRLSERVHGKFADSADIETLGEFVSTARHAMSAVCTLCLARAPSRSAMLSELPALEGFAS